jgi:branched-chain amino acid transport system substrate-binding protein
MKNKKFLVISMVLCLVLLVASLPLAGCGNGEETTKLGPTSTVKGTLKVGIMTPHTGKAAEKGVPLRDANLDCIEYINTELGGVNGYQIEAMNLDSGYDAAIAQNDINMFMDQGCIFFTTSSSTEMGFVKEIANRAGFPGLVAYASPSNYRPPLHIYGQTPDYGDDWIAFTNYFLANIWKGSGTPKMALMILSNPTGYGARDAAKAMADTLGVEIIATEEHAATTISETEALTRLKALGPDVIYIASTPKPAAVIIGNARELGITSTIGLGHAAMVGSLISLAGKDVVEGVYGCFPTVMWGEDVPAMAKMTEYVNKKHPADAGNPDYIAAWAQSLIIAEILKNALNEVGYDVLAKGDAAAWEAVEKYGFQKLNGYNVGGLQGTVTYSTGDNRLTKFNRVYQIHDGIIGTPSPWVEAPLVKYEDFDWFK